MSNLKKTWTTKDMSLLSFEMFSEVEIEWDILLVPLNSKMLWLSENQCFPYFHLSRTILLFLIVLSILYWNFEIRKKKNKPTKS